jgi:L-alanine-DL-glutamate epimerase-like enolase superfamily enzyme
MSDLRITNVRVRALDAKPLPGEPVRAPKKAAPGLSVPIAVFDDYRERSAQYWGPVGLVLVEVETDSGIVGYGTAGAGNAGTAAIIEHQFGPLVIGEDPFNVELIWSKMYRTSARYGRRGAAIAAISGIDIALWDIMGKALGVPVYELLGGAVRQDVQVYASKLYAPADLDELADEARGYLAEGYTMMKQRFGYGPQDGPAGVKGNVALVRTLRETVGDDVEISADAYMGWDLEYAILMERELRPYNLKWIEEPLMPHDVDGYERLTAVSQTPISHGEHCYTRWDFQELLDRRAGNILQPDVNRVGGITEARKIFAMGQAKGIPMIPHSNELHNLHFVFSQLNCPFTEYFPRAELDRNSMFWWLFDGNPEQQGGRLKLGREPGIGYRLNEAVAEVFTVEL